ncbi:MAG: DUF6273 domain-containing protein [Acidaminococcaceae bacterium]|nr:DUF6273 domain-containing protein [Acidaminococcaceae bacterium]
MTDLEMQVIQMLNEFDDQEKAELLKYGQYLKYCKNDENIVRFNDPEEERKSLEREIEYRVWESVKERIKQMKENLTDRFKSFRCVKLGKWHGEEVEWLVIDSQDNKQLLLSKYVIGKMRFDKSRNLKTWSESSLRSMLNGDFFSTILKYANVRKECYLDFEGDKVFLLSSEEFNKYIANKNEKFGVDMVSDGLESACYCNWMLRSGEEEDKVTFVNVEGDIAFGSPEDIYGVRPAMWIRL